MEPLKKHISVITPTYNEEDNVVPLVKAVADVFAKMPQYTYEHVFIDNGSTDKTVALLKELGASDPHVKAIVNARNFGHVRSSFHGMIQCYGDAVITLVADFQDPPELIIKFLEKWEEGYQIVIGIKSSSKENPVMFVVRRAFYKLLSKLSSTGEQPVQNFTGFGLYDQKFIATVRSLDDPYPYFRGLITELGYDRYDIEYTQPQRTAGKTKNNFFTLYDLAMLGFTNHSKLPLRISVFVGFFSAMMSFAVAFGYLVYKLIFWDRFQVGVAPLVIGVFFFSSVQLFFIGMIGEYIGAIHTQVRKRPLVIEKERVNF